MNKKLQGFILFESLLSMFILSQFIILFFILFQNVEAFRMKYLYERDFDFYTSIDLLEEEIANSSKISGINHHSIFLQKNKLETKMIEFIPKSKEIRIRGISGGFQPILMEVNDCSFQQENEHILKISMHFTDQKEEYSTKIFIPERSID